MIGVSPVGPFRTRHLDTSAASLALWERGGYNRSDVRAFLNATQYALRHPNVALDARITNAYIYRRAGRLRGPMRCSLADRRQGS